MLDKEMVFDPEENLEKEDGEAQTAAAVKDPGAPTRRELAEHELTHLPHRSWCPSCVAGRSRDRPYKRLSGRDAPSVPCVVFDYGFLGGAGEEEIVAVQVARDVGSKMLFAHVVPRKGLVANHGVKQLLKDIERLGHKKLCLKSDGEAAWWLSSRKFRGFAARRLYWRTRQRGTAEPTESQKGPCRASQSRFGFSSTVWS